MVRRAARDTAHAEEAVFEDQQLLLSTKVCVESRGASTIDASMPWFRFRSAANATPPTAVKSACDACGRARYNVGVRGGVWAPQAGEGFGVVVPCAGLHRFRLQLHDYCFSAGRAYAQLPASETRWLGGLTLWGAERHTSNLNHFNRDVLWR